MATPVNNGPDTTPPTQAGDADRERAVPARSTCPGCSTDNVGVTGYQVERARSTCPGVLRPTTSGSPATRSSAARAGCTNFAQIGTTTGTGTTYKDTSTSRLHQLQLPRPRHRRRRQPQHLLEHRQRHHPHTRHDPADAARDAEHERGQCQRGRPVLGCLDRQRRGHRLPGRALPGRRLHQLRPDRHDHRRPGPPTRTPATVASTSYSYRVRATDAAGNLSTYSNTASATTPGGPSGLVAAYAFDEGSGTTVADASGNGHNGTISNATWAATGKYGKALQFNGTNALVTVPNAAVAAALGRDDAGGVGQPLDRQRHLA